MSTDARHACLRIIVTLAVPAAATALAAAPAQAASATSALCASRFTATITPGFTMKPTTGTLTTHGQTGIISCVGKIGGHRITGPGSLGVHQNHSGATCRSVIGTGTVGVTLPTAAGRRHMVGALSVRRTALVVRVIVRFPDAHYSGAGVTIPTQGNCFVSPVRQAMVLVTGALSGARAT